MDEAEEWIRAHAVPTGPVEVTHERPWATVRRAPTANGVVWFKACAPVQAFEVRLSAQLFARWPDRVGVVLAHDEERGWLLLADAGERLWEQGNPPEAWLELLPLHAELQRGEAAHAEDHVAHGVPDLRTARLRERYGEVSGFAPQFAPLAARFAALCDELDDGGVADSIQHDDLHMGNVYGRRVLDWGDASVAHPFFAPWETFRFLESENGLQPGDPWFARLRDAYLEPWGPGLAEVFTTAQRVAGVAHVLAWLRQREHLIGAELASFDEFFPLVTGRALAGLR